MPDYSYTARTKAGLIQKDVMSAIDARGVADTLRAQGLTPTQISPTQKEIKILSLLDSFRRVKLLDRIVFIKNLGVMIKAGLPVSKSLKILVSQTPNPRFAKIVGEIARMVESGTSLADSMLKFPDVFSSIFISMVRAGELSGNLDQNLAYLADQMQRDYDLMSKAKGALTYPVVILIALALVGFSMFTFVLPKLTATFTDLNVPLPLMTRIIIGMTNICAHYGILVLLGFFAVLGAFFYWRKTDNGKKILHKVILYTPILSDIVVKINLARFVRVFASLTKSGMSIVESLEVSSHVVGNIYFQQTISDAAAKVRTGSPMSAVFKKQPKLFSNLVVQMMEVGEESGTTEEVLAEVANFYEAEVDQTMKNLSSILEPVIMMVIGVIVGFMAVALISPIYNIGNAIN